MLRGALDSVRVSAVSVRAAAAVVTLLLRSAFRNSPGFNSGTKQPAIRKIIAVSMKSNILSSCKDRSSDRFTNENFEMYVPGLPDVGLPDDCDSVFHC